MSKGILGKITDLYDKKYKLLLIIPAIMLLFSLYVLGNHYIQTGEFVTMGVSLKGGTTLSVAEAFDVKEIENMLKTEFPNADVSVRSLSRAGVEVGTMIEVSDMTSQELLDAVEKITGKLDKEKYTMDTTGSSLGAAFFKQAIFALIAAFVLISLVVYVYFRAALPSFYAVFSVVADMIFAMAICVVFDIRLTTAGIAAFLMLIGYSIDTDILLTTRVLKRKEGTVSERMAATVKTGITMTFAAFSSIIVGLLISESELLKQILFILGWGLFADVVFTWLFNAALLRMYVDSKERAKEKAAENANGI
ncbi:MMPL family transporter [Candidatus Woesearchaeota archaeon]|nr:MMPL family transporter [Candidatus Woesearchaeota archaeon]